MAKKAIKKGDLYNFTEKEMERIYYLTKYFLRDIKTDNFPSYISKEDLLQQILLKILVFSAGKKELYIRSSFIRRVISSVIVDIKRKEKKRKKEKVLKLLEREYTDVCYIQENSFDFIVNYVFGIEEDKREEIKEFITYVVYYGKTKARKKFGYKNYQRNLKILEEVVA